MEKSLFETYLEAAKKPAAKKYSREEVYDAVEEFAEKIANKPEASQEKWADTVGYKKYAHIFDTLSDKEHNDAMDAVWNIVADYNKNN